MACRTSVKARFLNTTLALARPYSLVNTSTILAFATPPTTPTVCPFRLSMLSMDDPGGATISTTTWLTTPTACACGKDDYADKQEKAKPERQLFRHDVHHSRRRRPIDVAACLNCSAYNRTILKPPNSD